MRLFKANASEIFIGKQYLQRGARVLGAYLVTGAAILISSLENALLHQL